MSILVYSLMQVVGGCVLLGPGIALVMWGVHKVRRVGLRHWTTVVACVCAVSTACTIVFLAVSIVFEASTRMPVNS